MSTNNILLSPTRRGKKGNEPLTTRYSPRHSPPTPCPTRAPPPLPHSLQARSQGRHAVLESPPHFPRLSTRDAHSTSNTHKRPAPPPPRGSTRDALQPTHSTGDRSASPNSRLPGLESPRTQFSKAARDPSSSPTRIRASIPLAETNSSTSPLVKKGNNKSEVEFSKLSREERKRRVDVAKTEEHLKLIDNALLMSMPTPKPTHNPYHEPSMRYTEPHWDKEMLYWKCKDDHKNKFLYLDEPRKWVAISNHGFDENHPLVCDGIEYWRWNRRLEKKRREKRDKEADKKRGAQAEKIVDGNAIAEQQRKAMVEKEAQDQKKREEKEAREQKKREEKKAREQKKRETKQKPERKTLRKQFSQLSEDDEVEEDGRAGDDFKPKPKGLRKKISMYFGEDDEVEEEGRGGDDFKPKPKGLRKKLSTIMFGDSNI